MAIPLTLKEQYILLLLTKGLRRRTIAADLDVSQMSLARTLSRIYGKIGVQDRKQAAVWYWRQIGGPR